MLSIVHHPSTHNNDAIIRLPDETSSVDRDRFTRLASVFYGHAAPNGSWIFTEMRGRKCLALWQAGFDARAQHGKADRRCIVHPNHPGRAGADKLFSVSQAVEFARIINNQPAAVVVENLD